MASTTTISPHKATFLASALSNQVLTFGTFTLKSGRQSPYFFNAGLFHTGELVLTTSRAYAHTLHTAGWDFDVLFGPAYKGIPLAAITVGALADLDGARYKGVSYSFNRKEKKDHGEGGSIVGAGLKGKRVVLIDDVITAGTAIREAIEIVRREGGTLVGIVVAFDRLEKMPAGVGEEEGAPRKSAIGSVRDEFRVPVEAILTLNDVVSGLEGRIPEEELRRVEEYREKYRASD